ncbi:type IV secretion system protein [Candidatus Phyllobacterium onerii]|uniref:type IV secretion system protein n=1 Tax=Candidatus Phyllobacterium onerii TaxID=3020828 RepID=UPI00232ACD53|nr:type IV secretion system protein [Phyllobacterium sp. IY22]
MEGANSIAALSSNIDSLGTNFTAATYGVFAYYLTPVMAALFTLYLIFWGFRFWQGQGGSIAGMVFKLVRIAIIFSLVTAWGPFQVALYGLFTNAPYMVSSVMLNHIVNPRSGKAMGFGTVANDLNAVYGFALTASAKIEQSAVAAAAPLPQPVSEEGSPPNPAKSNPIAQSKSPVDNPLTVPLSSSVQAAIIWIAAALFVGYAVALLLFAKVALWIMLALAPFFIVLLMFQIPSRYFSGWLTGTIQIILIPIFLTTFLSFYNIGIQDVVKALVLSLAKGSIPAMKDAGPFVLVCLTGFFLLTQIVPLSGRIATSSQEWFTNLASHAGNASRNIASSMAAGRGVRNSSGNTSIASAPAQLSHEHTGETNLREVQDRNAAVNRQSRNR